jgi:hypothetical protein
MVLFGNSERPGYAITYSDVRVSFSKIIIPAAPPKPPPIPYPPLAVTIAPVSTVLRAN